MPGFTATIYFFGGGIARHYDQELLDDPALRGSLHWNPSPGGGIILATDAESLYIEDDIDNVVGGLLTAVPAALRAGETVIDFPYHYGPEVVRIRVAGDEVSFDDMNGRVLAAPRDEVLAALDAARARHAELLARAAEGR